MKKILMWLCAGMLVISGVGCAKQEDPVYTGIIEGQEVSVRSEVTGVIQELVKKEGDSVNIDEKVAQLKDDLYVLQIDEAEAQVDAAKAKLDEVKEHGTKQAIEQAEAYVKQTESKWAQIKLQQSKTTAYSPEEGTILRKYVEKGELVQAGAVLYTVLKKQDLEVVIYIPVTNIGQVAVEQQVGVKVDAYPERTFLGKVTHIAGQAEFTPKNVHTVDERTKMVFAVTVKLTEGYDLLKPGMPADVNL